MTSLLLILNYNTFYYLYQKSTYLVKNIKYKNNFKNF